MDHTKLARCDWLAGLLIGLLPLLAHGLLHVAAKPDPNWDDNWSADVLFISISNSGMSAVTVFTRAVGGLKTMTDMKPAMSIFWAMTLVCFCLSGMLYGASVTGNGSADMIIVAVVFLIGSAGCSYNFEMAMAEHHTQTGPKT